MIARRRGTVSDLVPYNREGAVPSLITAAGGNARFAYDEFFRATISNPYTRRAYSRTVDRFLAWCEERGLHLHSITPGIAGAVFAAQFSRYRGDVSPQSECTFGGRAILGRAFQPDDEGPL